MEHGVPAEISGMQHILLSAARASMHLEQAQPGLTSETAQNSCIGQSRDDAMQQVIGLQGTPGTSISKKSMGRVDPGTISVWAVLTGDRHFPCH